MLYLLSIVIGYVIVCFGLFLFQRKMIFFPNRHIHGTPADIGIGYEEHFIESGGESINLWYSPHSEPQAYIIFFHGNAGNISGRLGTLKILYELNYSVLMFDYRGYGKSGGHVSENNCYEDAENIVKWLCLREQLQPIDIVYLGRSLGGGVASQTAVNIPPKKLILESTFTSIPAMARNLYPMFPTGLLLNCRFDNLSLMPQLSCPTLHIHSPEDETIPYDQGKTLFLANPLAYDFITIRGPHGDGFLLSTDIYIPAINSFISHKCESSA